MNSSFHAGGAEIRLALRAERSRIFYALTVAEYMELWAGDPHAVAVRCESELRDGGAFELTSVLANGVTISIKGIVAKYSPLDKVVFDWSHRIEGHDNHSSVTIGVLSRKARVVVTIGHVGLFTSAECDYFDAMWKRCTLWVSNSLAGERHQPLAMGVPRIGRFPSSDFPSLRS